MSRAIGAAIFGATATVVVRQTLEATQPGGGERWIRTNHRGEPITLMEGPAAAAGAAFGALLNGSASRAERVAQTVATVGAGAFGLYDDLAEDTSVRSKGLKGHLGALKRGQLTTGALKIIGIGSSALTAACIGGKARNNLNLFDATLDTVVIAGAANLGNLFDLRPGRALKVATGVGSVMSFSNAAGGALIGASAASFSEDLGERSMLGDCGANALGALAGTAITQSRGRGSKVLAAGIIVGLTLASEKVSFSKVIAGNKYLNAIDMIGRRPAAPTHDAVSAEDDNGTAADPQP